MTEPEDGIGRAPRDAALKILLRIYAEIGSLARLLHPDQDSRDDALGAHLARPENQQTQSERFLRAVAELGNGYKSQLDKDQQGRRRFERRYLLVLWCLFLSTLAAFGGAVYYAQIARQQKDATLESNRISREAQILFGRAFLVCQEVAARRLLGPHRWQSQMACENTGATPANVVAHAIHGDILPAEPGDEQFRQSAQMAGAVVGPRASQKLAGVPVREAELFGHDVFDLDDPGFPKTLPKYFIYGWIAYHDVFPGTPLHLTEFCRTLAGVEVDAVGMRLVMSYSPCDRHNCADEHCPDYREIASLAAGK